jgi:hypothetical protein
MPHRGPYVKPPNETHGASYDRAEHDRPKALAGEPRCSCAAGGGRTSLVRNTLPKGLTLEPGMIISPEWVTAAALGNFLWERNFLVTADGLEELSNFPDGLTVITN